MGRKIIFKISVTEEYCVIRVVCT